MTDPHPDPLPEGEGIGISGRVKQWLPALFVVLLAVAFRLNGLEWIRQNYDRAYPHGLGIFIRDAIADGRLDQLPRVSLLASINFPNPAGTSYFYALLASIEASPYIPTALNAMFGAVVAAVAFNIARRLFGSVWAATAAGVFAAVSPWAAWVSRGAWLQGPIEPMAALTFWLLFNAITANRPRHILAAFVWVAACLHTYLVALGLLSGTVAVGALGGIRSLAHMRRAIPVGLSICLVSLLVYLGALASQRASLQSVIANPNAINEQTRAGQLNLDPIAHVLRMPGGRDYEKTFVESDTPMFALREVISDARATATDGLLAIGILTGAGMALRNAKARLPLIWLVLPVVGTLLIANLVMRDWKVHVFYLLLTSPAPYVLAAAPIAWVEQASNVMRQNRRLTFDVLRLTLLVLALPTIGIPWWNMQGDIDSVQRYPYTYEGLPSIPLGWQMKLAQQLGNCDTVATNETERNMWLMSLTSSAQQINSAAFAAGQNASAWLLSPKGNDCLLTVGDAAPVTNAASSAITLPGQKRTDYTPVVVNIYRSAPPRFVNAPVGEPSFLTTNLGWTLLDQQMPQSAQRGSTFEIDQTWRIDTLPTEDFGQWYFAPFVKLIAPDGKTIVDVNDAPTIIGYKWRQGHVIMSTIKIAIPADAPTGLYTVELSLFDPNQKKNAVYFNSFAPSNPIVTIQRRLSVE